MAHVEEQQKGSRVVNVEVNLVPFIDLMSVLVIFLLITAVWVQVSMIQLGTSIYGQKVDDQVAKPPERMDIPLRIDVRSSEYRLIIGRQTTLIPNKNGDHDDEALLKELKGIKQIYQDKTDAVVAMADQLPYNNLIRAMDRVLEAGFPEIAVIPEVK